MRHVLREIVCLFRQSFVKVLSNNFRYQSKILFIIYRINNNIFIDISIHHGSSWRDGKWSEQNTTDGAFKFTCTYFIMQSAGRSSTFKHFIIIVYSLVTFFPISLLDLLSLKSREVNWLSKMICVILFTQVELKVWDDVGYNLQVAFPVALIGIG